MIAELVGGPVDGETYEMPDFAPYTISVIVAVGNPTISEAEPESDTIPTYTIPTYTVTYTRASEPRPDGVWLYSFDYPKAVI